MPDDPHRAFLARSRFGDLDGLRALCILAVLWHHGPVWAAGAEPSRLAGRGFLGVDMFFVLSGFLITTLLLRERSRAGRISLPGFYARRARRILPPYLLVVTAASAWFVVAKGEAQLAPLVPFYYLFLANFLTEHVPLLEPMWSLSVEEQYYLLWPLLLILLPPRWLVPALGAGVALNVAGATGLLPGTAPEWGPLRFALPNATYAPILLGSAGAVLVHGRAGFGAARALLGGPWAAPLLLGAVVLAAALLPADLRGLPNLLIHCLMLMLLLALALPERSALSPVLSAAPVARLGRVSYGVYLYHLAALHVAHVVLSRLGADDPWTVLLAYAALSWLIAEASFRWLEAPILRRRPGRAAASA